MTKHSMNVTSALMAMHSIYIGQLVWSAAAALTMHMRVCLGDVAIVYYYPHPALAHEYDFFTCHIKMLAFSEV